MKDFKHFKITSEVDNADICNLHSIELIDQNEFLEKFRLYVPTVPKKYSAKTMQTLCNIKTLSLVYEQKDIFYKKWKGKTIVFPGSKLSDDVLPFFPMIDFSKPRCVGVALYVIHLTSLQHVLPERYRIAVF